MGDEPLKFSEIKAIFSNNRLIQELSRYLVNCHIVRFPKPEDKEAHAKPTEDSQRRPKSKKDSKRRRPQKTTTKDNKSQPKIS